MPQASLVLEMPARRGVLIVGPFADCRSAHDGYAHEAQFRVERNKLSRRRLQRRMALVVRMLGIDRHHDDRHTHGESTWPPAHVVAMSRAPPPSDLRSDADASRPARALAERNLFRVAKIERDMRSRLVARAGFGFQTTQDDLLQPWRHFIVEGARRYRHAPQPIAHSGVRLRDAEWLLAGGKLVEQRA